MALKTSKWGLLKFGSQKEILLHWEGFHVRLLKQGSDLLIIENRGEKPASSPPDGNLESDFRRYAFEKPIEAIRVRPATPDRPLVVQPIHPLHLAPKATVEFYISIPLDIQISNLLGLNQSTDEPLERFRPEILSDTWFGDPLAGILCYALKSRARRECPQVNSEEKARAICKVQIHNASPEQLQCRQFCIRLEHCQLWQSDTSIWTSLVNIRYNGAENLSTINYDTQPPDEAKDALKVAEAREEPLSGIIRRTFTGVDSPMI